MRKPGRYLLFEVQTVTETQGALGMTESWNTTSKWYGRIISFSGYEKMKAMALSAKATHRISGRFRPGIIPKNRLKLGTRVFNILDIENVGSQNKDMVFTVEEVLS
jgi:head-tail adaptor